MDEVGEAHGRLPQKEKELEREHLEKLVKEEDRSIKPMKEFESPEDLYHELIASVRKYHPSADISLIEKGVSCGAGRA